MAINVQAESAAADMERVFRPLAGRTVAPVGTRAVVTTAARGRRSRWLMFGAPMLVLVAGTALGVNYVSEAWRPQMVSARLATPVRDRSTGPAAATPYMVTQTASPTYTDPMAGEGDTRAAEAPAPPDPQGARDDVSRPSSLRAAQDGRVAVPASAGGARPAADDRAARVAAVRRGGDAGAALPGCVPGSLEDRCIYQDVLNADGRLRRAFDRAKQDGVSNRDLTVITRRWRQARELAGDDPDGTIRRYDQLADALDDLRRDTGE